MSSIVGSILPSLPAGDRKIRLLLAIDALDGGGAERVMAELANSLNPDRYEIRIVLTLTKICVQTLAPHVNVAALFEAQPPIASDFRPRLLLWFWRGIAARNRRLQYLENFRLIIHAFGREVAAWKPDCIVSFLNNTNLICLLAKRWYGFDTPILCNDHTVLSREIERLPWKRLRRFLVRRDYRHGHQVAVAPVAGRDLNETFSVPAERITTILNGVDIRAVRELAAQPIARELVPGETGDLRIVAVGRLNVAKAFDVLLQAVSRLRTKHWQLLLIGDGEESEPLRALSRQLGITDRVHFLGWQTNPYQWMAQCDLYVLSSRYEGMPLALLEALAVGLPIIATRCSSGPVEILDQGHYGRLVPAESADALAGAIDEVLSDEGLRRNLAALASERAGAFDVSGMVANYDALIRSVIDVC